MSFALKSTLVGVILGFIVWPTIIAAVMAYERRQVRRSRAAAMRRHPAGRQR